MKTHINFITASLILLISGFTLSSCYTEDPGPLQADEREFAISNFDRLDMGSAFNITVTQGSTFEVIASGDRRNLDDLSVYKDGSTLVIQYNDYHHRTHQTNIRITMPSLRSFNFSGASYSTVSGFSEERVDAILSGASISNISMDANDLHLNVSGASNLIISGDGLEVDAEVSGSSMLNSIDFVSDEVNVSVSGASQARVHALTELNVVASGASVVYYVGTPDLNTTTSGGSTVIKY